MVLDERYHVSSLNPEELYLLVNAGLMFLFTWIRRISILLLGLQVSGFMIFSVYRLSLSLWQSVLRVLPANNAVTDLWHWTWYFFFEVLEIGRYPVLLGNVLVVIAIVAFLGEMALHASLIDHGKSARTITKIEVTHDA